MKRIITCSDGTWNKPNEVVNRVITPTNVWKLYDLIAPNNKSGLAQVSFYDEGVGTNWYDALPGGILGMGINRNIIQAYQFIAENYEPGDEIYLFGFSRGAYTARSIAGFIRNSGMLRKENMDKLEEAFVLYKRRDDASKPDADEALEFKKKYCFDNVRIKFIGVWDTVGALGIPLEVFDVINRELLDCRFHDVELSSYVDYAYHAVAIDEHRKPFLPTLWEQQQTGIDAHQVMEQMWFAGAHRDVGGGYNERGLSDCALQWMIQKAENVGLMFKDSSTIIPKPLDIIHNSMSLFYEIFGSKDRKMGNGPAYNEAISPAVKARWDADTDHYRENANPNILNFISQIIFRG